ncbi:hypothetical protein ACGYJ8_15355 [Sulfitobacter sp. 1A12126]|uniref:DUF1281 family ferredoxin-like fold protein n=1 Tax=Sulfitobacter sp. 1A12126 TaxID=3368591 RepID=UPI003746CB41
MPNHIVNEIRLHGVEAAKVRAIASGPERVIDFEKLLPLPLNFWPGSVSMAHRQAFPGTHLDAATETWGTKWNAYALTEDSLWEDGTDTILTFETAWAPPRGWVVAVFSTLECDITHHWQDEGSDDVHRERYTFTGDNSMFFPKWEADVVEQGSDDHRRLYKLQWGVETPAELAESI